MNSFNKQVDINQRPRQVAGFPHLFCKRAGFTLIEVMIALFIIAVALGGAIKAMGNAANTSAALADKTFAQWVGLNQFAKLKLSGEWPRPGEQKGEDEMAHREWRWVRKITTTEDKNVNRVEIFVSDKAAQNGEGYAAKIVGFLAKPPGVR